MICTPSRFIKEIPDNLVRIRTYAPRDVIAQQVRENNNTGRGKGAKKKTKKKPAAKKATGQ